jgi:WD40 repeat protein/serine/threonine protein kinase
VTIQSRGTIQGYELLERIGSGGFGAVYRAYQSTLGREVAVKIILPNYANHPEFIRHFEREAQLVSRLEHLHIVPLYDYWRDSVGAYIVMRWMRGGTLAASLQKDAFDLQSASLLLDQVASGLAAAHHQHIIHRDLKPSNILLDEEGNAYLGDFGIAMDLRGVNEPAEDDKHHPTSGEIALGSRGYMSPEQLRGQGATPQSDIYSLGVTLYEVLTGRPPFPAQNSVQQLFKQIDDSLPVIENLDEDVLEDINQVIQKATDKNPRQRYQDALAFAAAFRQAAALNNNGQATELVESLTLREHEILYLLVEGNTNRQIAQRLYVELPTIKWHISNIYKKLGVRSRVQAIVRARELNLIVSTNEFEPEGKSSSPTALDLPEPVNPYKGLRSFEPADNRDFFGREAVIERLLDKLSSSTPLSSAKSQAEGRFLAVVGPSGSGKSSLVKAGLIPALWSGKLPSSDKWFVINIVPGARPLDNLETSLSRVAANQASNLREHLDRDIHGLTRIANLILPNDDSELVVIIDQFEQLFTMVEDESTRSHFLDLIEQAVTDLHSRVRVIITLRADYYDRPLQYAKFGRLIQTYLETLLPLSAEELERAIVYPAHQVGVDLEPGLSATIIEDVNYRPGNLPLLQYALTELFDQRAGRLLTSQAFSKIGGAGGALARRAEQLYHEQDDQGQEMIRQMFLRLVNVGEPLGIGAVDVPITSETSRRVLHAELLSAAVEPDQLDEIIDTYVDYRLLTLDHDPATRKPTIELAHEAILQAWDRLRSWLEESANDLSMHRQLIRATSEWVAGDREESFLLRGARLTNIESWTNETQLVFTEEERAYVAACVAARQERAAVERQRQDQQAHLEQKSNRRLKALVGVMALALVIAAGLTIAAISFAHRAEEQQLFAEAQQRLVLARELASAAIANLESNPERSVLLALEAAETTLTADGSILPEVERILHLAVQADRTEITIPMGGLVAFSPNGKALAIGNSNGRLKLWETETGQEIRELGGHISLISGLSFSPDGRFLASSSFDLQVKIWDLASGSQLGLIKGFDSQVNNVAFSPDGGLLATVDQDGPVRIWDVTSIFNHTAGESISLDITEIVFIKQAPQEANDVAFSPDGERVAVFMPRAGIIVWDVDSGEQVLEIPGVTDFVSGITFSPDGEYLAGGSGDLGAAIWDAETGKRIMLLPETSPITKVAFSQDGHMLATSAKNGMVSLWDIETRAQKIRILGQPTGFNFMALSPDDQKVAVGSNPNSTSLWDVTPTGEREVLTIPAHEGKVFDAIYNLTGSRIASTGEDGSLRIWDAATGDLLHDLPAQADWVHFPAFSPDGKKLAAANEQGGISLWDVNSGHEILTILNDGPAFTAVAFSRDGSRLAAGGLGGYAHIWDVESGRRLATIDNNDGLIITELIFSPDGESIFSYDWQGWNLSWNSHTGELLSGRGPDPVCEATLWDAELSADGQLQAVAAFDGLTYVFRANYEPGDEPNYVSVLGLSGHEGNVTGVAFNEQGTLLVIRLWDLELSDTLGDKNSGEEISVLTDQILPLGGVDFSPDGHHVVTAGDDGMVRVFVVGIEELMELARSRLSRDFTSAECREYLHLPYCEED